MSSGRRIRPERSAGAQRRNVQKLTWRDSHWLQGFSSDDPQRGAPPSASLSDMGVGAALRRVLLLCERQQHREAAALLSHLAPAVFRALVAELPVEALLEQLPASLPPLEALYARAAFLEEPAATLQALKPDALVLHMARLFAQQHDADRDGAAQWLGPPQMIASCKKLLKVILQADPRARQQLRGRKQSLDRALEGLGQHGLVTAAGGSADAAGGAPLLHLSEALRGQLESLLSRCKTGALRLSAGHEAARVSLSRGPAPSTASHQRQLSLRRAQVQERLIRNKTLLDALEPAEQAARGLEALLAVLRRRIQLDKDALCQFTQLRKEIAEELDEAAVLAPVLLRYSAGCQRVLELMRDVADDEDDSDLSAGYHSDSDQSGVPMRAAGAPGCKALSSNFSSTSSAIGTDVRSSLSSSDSGAAEELAVARQTIATLQQRQRELQDRLAVQAQRMVARGGRFENAAQGEQRPSALVRRYGSLYAQARVDTLDALDAIPQLRDADELKSKLLFSVVVLGFRSVQNSLSEMKAQVRRALQIPAQLSSDPRVLELDASVDDYLRANPDACDVSRNVEEVCAQIWATLYDYPCLKGCAGLTRYVCDCVRLAWALSVHGFALEFETRAFWRELHVRFHTSDHRSERIRTYLWPALLQAPRGPCVHKAVVIT
ncbi:uncharacterized protein [Dermacentor albipictus]|uniref:uncharacterized protein n=1 Tax=Dermacentor albipictus TaxID=60249 RepID=UPI0031FD564F